MNSDELSHSGVSESPYNTVELPPTIEIKESSVRRGEAGAFSKILIKKDTRYGPYKGEIISAGQKDYIDYRYAWEVFEKNSDELKYTISAINPKTSNWMRNVNCARFYEEQNILSIQEGFSIFYVAMKDIKPGEELLTWFDPKLLKRTQRRLSKMERKPVGYTIELVPWDETEHFVPKIIETKRARKKKVLSDMICLDEDPLAMSRTVQKLPKIPYPEKQLSQSSKNETWSPSGDSARSSSVVPIPVPVLVQPQQLQQVKKKRGRKPKNSGLVIAPSANGNLIVPKEGVDNCSTVPKNDATNSGIREIPNAFNPNNSDGNVPNPPTVKKKRGRKKGSKLLRNGPVKLGRPKLRRTSGGEIAPDDLATVKPVVVKAEADGSITVEDHDETYSLRNIELRQECDEKCPCLDKKEAMKTHQDMQNVFVIHFTLLPEHRSETPDKKIIYRCDICDSAYNHAFSLKRHYLGVHINHRYLSRDDILSCQIETFHTGVELSKPFTGLEQNVSTDETNVPDITSNNNAKVTGDREKIEDNLLCNETLADEREEQKKLSAQKEESQRKLSPVPSLISMAQSLVDRLKKKQETNSEKSVPNGEQNTTERKPGTNLSLECHESLSVELIDPQPLGSEIKFGGSVKGVKDSKLVPLVKESNKNKSSISQTRDMDMEADNDTNQLECNSMNSQESVEKDVPISPLHSQSEDGQQNQLSSMNNNVLLLLSKDRKDVEPQQGLSLDAEKVMLADSVATENNYNSISLTQQATTNSYDNNSVELNHLEGANNLSATVNNIQRKSHEPEPNASNSSTVVEDINNQNIDTKIQIPSTHLVESNSKKLLSEMTKDLTGAVTDTATDASLECNINSPVVNQSLKEKDNCEDTRAASVTDLCAEGETLRLKKENDLKPENPHQASEKACTDVEMTENNNSNSLSVDSSVLSEQQEGVCKTNTDKAISADMNMNSELKSCDSEEIQSSVNASNEVGQINESQDSSAKREKKTEANINPEVATSVTQTLTTVEKSRANQAQQQVIFVTNIVFPILSPTPNQPTTTSASILPPSTSVQGSSAVTSSVPIIQKPLTSQASGVPLVLISQIPHGLNVQNAATALLQSSTALKTLQTIQSSLNVMNLGNTATQLSSSNLPGKSPTSVLPGICFSSQPKLIAPAIANTSQPATSSTPSPLILTKSTLPLVSPVALPSLNSSHIILSPPTSKNTTISSNENDTSKVSNPSHLGAPIATSPSSKSYKPISGQPDDLYRCHMCVLVFKTMSQLKHHIKNDPHRFKGGIKQYACMQCSMRFSNKNNLLRHNEMNHNENEDYKFRCFTCGKGFTTETYLKMHARFHSGKNFPCKYGCKDTYFPNAASLVKHLRTQHAGLNLKEYLKNAKAEKARRKKLNRIFGVSDEQITRLGIDGSAKERPKLMSSSSVPYSMTQPGIGFQAKRGRPKGSKNHAKREKPDFIRAEKERPLNPPVSELTVPSEKADGTRRKNLKIRFRCKLCQKGFTTHLRLLQHRSSRHGASESVQEYLYEMSKDVQDEEYSDADFILQDVSPPPSPKTFFANVNRKGLENMTNYIDCNSESLKSWRKHIKFDDYDSISSPFFPSLKSMPNLELTMFNFSPNFQYKEDCTLFYDGTPAGQSAYSDGLVEQKRNKNAIRDELDSSCLSDTENMTPDSGFVKTEVPETTDVDFDSQQLKREIKKEEEDSPEEDLKFEPLSNCGLKSQERGNSIISRLEQHLKSSIDQGRHNVKTEPDISVQTGEDITDTQIPLDHEDIKEEKTGKEDTVLDPEECEKLEGEDNRSTFVSSSILDELFKPTPVKNGSLTGHLSEGYCAAQDEKMFGSQSVVEDITVDKTHLESFHNDEDKGTKRTDILVNLETTAIQESDKNMSVTIASRDEVITNTADSGFNSLSSISSGSMDLCETISRNFQDCLGSTAQGKNSDLIESVATHQEKDVTTPIQILTNSVFKPKEQLLPQLPAKQKLDVLKSPYIQGINLEANVEDLHLPTQCRKVTLLCATSYSPVLSLLNALDLQSTGGSVSSKKLLDMLEKSNLRFSTPIKGHRHRTISLPSLGLLSPNKRSHRLFNHSLEASLNASENSRHDHRRYSIWGGQMHHKINKRKGEKMFCCPVVEAVRKQEFIRQKEKYEYEKALREKEMNKQQSKFYREKVNFAEMMGLTLTKEYGQSHIAKRQQEHCIKPPEIWDNYENIWFGKRGNITVVCSICHRHFSCLDLCWRHQLKKHPHIEPSSLEMERGNDVEDLHYYYPMRYGILAQTQLIPDNLPPPEVYACTRCGFPFKNLNKLHAHMIACDPSQEEISLSQEGKQHKPSYMKKKLLPMMDRRLNQEPDFPPPKPKVGRPYGSSTISKMTLAADGLAASTPGSRKRNNIKSLSRASEHRPTTSVFQNRAGFSSPYSFFNGRRRKNYELLYNPQNHTRRRELYQVLDQHQCHGCNLKFKSLSLLERHVKKCIGRDKLQSQKPLLSGIIPDDAAMRKQHTCRYCNKRFTYIKGVDLHYKRICAVRKVKEEENQLTQEDFLHEAELKRIIEHMKWSKSFNKDSSDIIQGNVKVEEDGTLTRVAKKRGWPRGLKKKIKKKGFKWTTLKRHRPEDEMGEISPSGQSPQSSPEVQAEDAEVQSDIFSENNVAGAACKKRVTRTSSLDDMKKDSGNTESTISQSSSANSSYQGDLQKSSSTEKKPGKRGRPRKYDLDGNLIAKPGKRVVGGKATSKVCETLALPQTKTFMSGVDTVSDCDTVLKPPARKRGRPKKFDPSDVGSSYKKNKNGDSNLDPALPMSNRQEESNSKTETSGQSLALSRQPRNKTLTPSVNDDYVYESPTARKKRSSTGSNKSSKVFLPNTEASSDMIEKMKQLKEAALSEMTKEKQMKGIEPKKTGLILNTLKAQNSCDGKDEEKTYKSPQGSPTTTELFKHLTKDPPRSVSIKNTVVSSVSSHKLKGLEVSKSQESEPSMSKETQSSTFSSSKRKQSTELQSTPSGKRAKISAHSLASKTSVNIKTNTSSASCEKSAAKSDIEQKIEKASAGSKSGASSVSRVATTSSSVKTTTTTNSAISSSSTNSGIKVCASSASSQVQKPTKVSVRVVTLSPNGTNLLTFDSPSDVPTSLTTGVSSSLKTNAILKETPARRVLSTLQKGGAQIMGKGPVQQTIQDNLSTNQAIFSEKNLNSGHSIAFQGHIVQAPAATATTTSGIGIQKPTGQVLYKYADGHIVKKTDEGDQLEASEIVYKYADGHVHVPVSDTSQVDDEPDNEDIIYVFEDEHGDQHYVEEDQLDDVSLFTQNYQGEILSSWSEAQPSQTFSASASSHSSLGGQVTVLCTAGQMQKTLPTPVIQSLSQMGQIPTSDISQSLSAKDKTHIQIKGGVITPKLEGNHFPVSGETTSMTQPLKSEAVTLSIPAGVRIPNPSSHVGKLGTVPAVVVSSPSARLMSTNVPKNSLGTGPSQRLTSPPPRLVPQTKVVTMTGTVIPNVIQGGVVQSGPRVLKLGNVIGTKNPSFLSLHPQTASNTFQAARHSSSPIPTVVTAKPLLLNTNQIPRVVTPGARLQRPLGQPYIKTVPVTGSHIISVGSRQTMSSSSKPPVVVQNSNSSLQHLNIQQHKIITLPQPQNTNTNSAENSNPVEMLSGAKVQPPTASKLQNPLQTNQIMISLEDGTTAMLDPDSLAQFLSVSPPLSKNELDSISSHPCGDTAPETTMVAMEEMQQDMEASDEIIWSSSNNMNFMEISDSDTSCQF